MAGPKEWSDGKKLAALIAAVTAARCLLAASVPLLAVEAYYWTWGRHLAAGYYDHPPMVGLMSALFFGWIDGSELAARSGPLALGVLTILAVYGLAREIFPGGRTAWRAAALCALTPMFGLNGVLIQPDNSLVLFTVLTWWAFWRAARNPERLGPWLVAGVGAGLMLLSKFHAWVLLPPLWGFLLLSPSHRKLLKKPGPWIAAVVALVVLSPNLVWDARNDWMNYAFQWRRSDLGEAEFEVKNVLTFLLAPGLMLSPLVYAAMVWGVWKGFKAWRAGEVNAGKMPAERAGETPALRTTGETPAALLYLLCAGLPLPLFLGLLSPMVTISVHWPATGYVALLVLAAALLERGELFGRRFWRAAMGLCIAMTILVHVLPLPFLVMRLPSTISFGQGLISTGRLKREYPGWREIGALAERMRREMSQAESAPAVIMARNWHLASMLAFYSGSPGEVFALDADSAHNFEIWRGERGGLAGANAVVVIKNSKPNKRHRALAKKYSKSHKYLDPLFDRVEEAPSLLVYEDGTIEPSYLGFETQPPRLREFLVLRCYGFKGRLHED